jgi:hypothetical protein
MQVSLGQLSVQFDSYPDGGRGNRVRRSSGDKGLPWADRANLRAATRSESRAGSESTVVTPTRHQRGEGRRIMVKQPTDAAMMVTGVIGSGTQGRFFDATRETRNSCKGATCNAAVGWRAGRESERPIVLGKPGNAGGRKGPHFRVLQKQTRTRRLA